jgi:hypothetical protein
MAASRGRKELPAHVRPSCAPAIWMVVPLLLPLLGGCVTIEGRVAADGSGSFVMRYKVPSDATEFFERRQFSSPHVFVDSVKINENLDAEVRAHFDDVTQLPTAPGFHDLTVTRGTDPEAPSLTFVIHRIHVGTADKNAPGPEITVTLPGAVREANHRADVSGNRVTWRLSLDEYMRDPETTVSVRWTPPAPARAGKRA